MAVFCRDVSLRNMRHHALPPASPAPLRVPFNSAAEFDLPRRPGEDSSDSREPRTATNPHPRPTAVLERELLSGGVGEVGE